MIWVPLDLLQIEIGANSWSLRQFKISIHDARKLGQQLALPRLVEFLKRLLQPRIRRGDINVQTCQVQIGPCAAWGMTVP